MQIVNPQENDNKLIFVNMIFGYIKSRIWYVPSKNGYVSMCAADHYDKDRNLLSLGEASILSNLIIK